MDRHKRSLMFGIDFPRALLGTWAVPICREMWPQIETFGLLSIVFDEAMHLEV
jgi:hypothetical protein